MTIAGVRKPSSPFPTNSWTKAALEGSNMKSLGVFVWVAMSVEGGSKGEGIEPKARESKSPEGFHFQFRHDLIA